jgi:phosphate-selective porin OprO/OprP
MRKIVPMITSILLAFTQLSVVEANELGDLKEQVAEQTERLQEAQKRLEKLEARQMQEERFFEEQLEELKQQEPDAYPSDFRVYWKEGLNLATLDGDFKLKIGGRLQTDWFFSSEDQDIKLDPIIGEQEDGVEFRRARIYFSGLIYDNIEYKLQFDFADGNADFKDAYLGLTDFPLGKLRMGHFKEPFSLDELTSSKYITFLERALPNAFAPGRNTGFMLHNVAANERITTAIGLFRDTDNDGDVEVGDGDDGGYNVTGRITALPIYKNKGTSLVHVGAAYSHRKPDDSYSFDASPEAHLADDFVDTGSILGDRVELLGLEAAWVNGPFSLQSEYIMADAGRFTGSDAHFDGYYVQASYFLTGEHRKYKISEGAFSRVKPKEDYKASGGSGAWEAKARYSELDLSDSNITGGKLDNITLGMNWYLNPNTRIMWDYVHADKDDVGQANMLMMRLQFDF